MIGISRQDGWKKKAIQTSIISLFVLSSLVLSFSLVSGVSPDFTLSADKSYLCVNPGINGRFVISVSSLGGFTGNVGLSAQVTPAIPNAPTLSHMRSEVDLSGGQTVNVELVGLTSSSTTTTQYSIMVTGDSGAASHTITLIFTVSNVCAVLGGSIIPTAGLRATLLSYAGYGVAFAALGGAVAAVLVISTSRTKKRAGP